MNRNRVFSTALTLAAAIVALVPARAAAQAEVRGPFVGAGGGVGNVAKQDVDDSRFGLMLHARAGWRLGHALAPMVEVGIHGLGDDEPRNGDIVITNPSGGTQVVRRPSMLSTLSVLASLQVGLPGAYYVRPGVGVGYHAFPSYNLFGSDLATAETSHEAGPAAGIAIGRTLNVAGRFPIAVEGIGLWSHGEDSTGSRWAAGLQVVPMIRF
jgi:hypothetical protein